MDADKQKIYLKLARLHEDLTDFVKIGKRS